MTQKKEAQSQARVYKYTGQGGTVYYSFTRRPKMITTSQILSLESRIGTHVENFIPKFRAEGRKFMRKRRPGDEEDETGKTAKSVYEGIDFKPPVSVANAAAKGLEYRRKQSDKAGLTPAEAAKEGIGSGVQRAVNLKNRDTLSPATIRQMNRFFSRHEKNKAIDSKFKNEPWRDKGYDAWLLWGGDPGKSWVKKILGQMDRAEEES